MVELERILLSSYCTHCIGQQLVLYLAVLSVKLHVVIVLLFEQMTKEGWNYSTLYTVGAMLALYAYTLKNV